MMQSISDIINNAVKEYNHSQRDEWVLKWPGMVVLCGASINWTIEVETAIERKLLHVKEVFFKYKNQLFIGNLCFFLSLDLFIEK